MKGEQFEMDQRAIRINQITVNGTMRTISFVRLEFS